MKRVFLFAALLALTAVAVAQQPADTLGRPRVAVVLSGGGAKGVAHIGALKVIEAAGIPVDMVCGTSMGALMGGLYCIGYSPEELDSLVRAQNWSFLLSDRKSYSFMNINERRRQHTFALRHEFHQGGANTDGGVIRGANLATLFNRLCSGYTDSLDFNQLPIPFACVATNLVDYGEVDFHSGSLPVAMRASMAIPGVFTPVRIGDSVLVDGGLTNNFPADIARQMGADIIIGVTVKGDLEDADGLDDMVSILGQIMEFGMRPKYEANAELCDVLITVDVHGYTTASFNPPALDTLMRRGEEAAFNSWRDLVAIAERTGIDTQCRTASPLRRHHLQATGRSTAKPVPSALVGFRSDSEELGALQLGFEWPLLSSVPMELDATLRLGNRLMARVDYMLFPKGFTRPMASIAFHDNNLDIYTNGHRTHNARYRQLQLDLVPLNFLWRRTFVQIGLRWDYFNYYGGLLSDQPISYDISDDHYFSYHATLMRNTENNWYYPTRGFRFRASYAYRTTNLVQFNRQVGLSDISAYWRTNLAIASRLTLQPMLYGRMLLGDEVPLAFSNALGSEWFGHTVEQQMPFPGIGRLEYIEPQFAAFQLQAQYSFGRNHYALLRLAAGINAASASDLVGSWPNFVGIQLGYSYSTLVGPLDARLGWSNRTNRPYLFLSFGHEF